ncbi:MAG: hypothetical protein JNJ57_14345 [Saprospiraceae bacterium]|nr:hypothetical protein [Saprospiraceae bacterium]
MNIRLLLLLFLVFAHHAHAQESLASSDPFFQNTGLPAYQKWLDGAGLGRALRAQSAEVKNDTMLALFLGFNTTDADTAKALWLRLRADFAKKTGGDVLETVLFEKIAWYFEVPPRQARLYLNDNQTGAKARCWEARMVPSAKGFAPVFQERTYDCGFKHQDFPVVIGPQDLGGMRAPNSAAFKQKMLKKAVFESLKPWLVQRFQKPQPDGGWSHIIFTDEWQSLKFEVDDLRKEVINNATSSWLCEALCQCRTCLPYEKLEVCIKYEAEDENSGAFKLNANISAKYGSGIWKPRGGGWHDLDDEPAKKELLKQYGELLMADIKRFLLSKP